MSELKIKVSRAAINAETDERLNGWDGLKAVSILNPFPTHGLKGIVIIVPDEQPSDPSTMRHHISSFNQQSTGQLSCFKLNESKLSHYLEKKFRSFRESRYRLQHESWKKNFFLLLPSQTPFLS